MDAFVASLRGAWDFLTHLYSTAPLGFWAVVAGLLMSLGVTLWLKRWLPRTWGDDARRFAVQNIALVSGVLATWLPWRTLEGMLAGILIGFLSPYVWAGFAAIVGHYWPWLLGRERGDA